MDTDNDSEISFASQNENDDEDPFRNKIKELPTSRHRDTTLITYYTDFKNNRINVDPIYQRGAVWSVQRKANFIHQLFRRRMTIPPIQLNDLTEDTIQNVIDGKQRLLSIFTFMENEYPLSDGTFYSHPVNKSLSNSERRRFDLCVMGAIVYENLPEDDEIDIFQNLQNGVPLISGEKLSARNDPISNLIRQLLLNTIIFNKQNARNGNFKHAYMMVLSIIDKKGVVNLTGIALAEKSDKITLEEYDHHKASIVKCFNDLHYMKYTWPEKYNELTTLDIVMLGHFMCRQQEKNDSLQSWLDAAVSTKKQQNRINDNLTHHNITQLKTTWNKKRKRKEKPKI